MIALDNPEMSIASIKELMLAKNQTSESFEFKEC